MFEKEIKVCEHYLGIRFCGNINDRKEVIEFLNKNYSEAVYRAAIAMEDPYIDQI